jgi:hypothetical protein
MENQNSAAFTDNSVEFTDNSTAFTDNSVIFEKPFWSIKNKLNDAVFEKYLHQSAQNSF